MTDFFIHDLFNNHDYSRFGILFALITYVISHLINNGFHKHAKTLKEVSLKKY